MNPNEQIVAIGECIGWKWHGDESWQRDPTSPYWKIGKVNYQQLPDYMNDLNACYDMEETLSIRGSIQFGLILRKLVIDATEFDSRAKAMEYHASSEQRCEAFLRVNKLWKD